jgi:hypothetical protein
MSISVNADQRRAVIGNHEKKAFWKKPARPLFFGGY